MFRKNSRSQVTLLNNGAPDLRRDTEVPDAVISTWEISFIQIRKQCLAAANLLSLMAMFSRQGIPDFLIKPEIQEEDDQSGNDGSLQDPEFEFEQAIGLLIDFSLVRAETNKKFFEMHRLVQLATRRWLQSTNLIQEWKSNAIAKMADTLPTGKYENWNICDMLLPHANEVIAYQTADRESSLKRVGVLSNVAWYSSSSLGDHRKALQLCEEASSIQRQFLREDDRRLLCGMTDLAIEYDYVGEWNKAKELLIHVLEKMSRVSGDEDPQTLSARSALASVFHKIGQLEEAKALSLQVFEVMKRVLGAEHPVTLTSMNNLAIALFNKGQLEEAKALSL
jgi:tetratricopeptide (TPR) repeat protein